MRASYAGKAIFSGGRKRAETFGVPHSHALSDRLFNQEKHHIHHAAGDILCFDVDVELDPSLPAKIGAKVLPPIAAIAPQQFHRIFAQHGVFTVFHRDYKPLENQATKQSLKQFLVPAASKARIMKELTVLKIDKLAIFPSLSSVAEKVKAIV